MSLTLIPTNTNNTVIQATDVNQVIKVLQQPSGGQEIGHYFLEEPSYVTGGTCSWYFPSLSSVSVPVSVTLDTTDQGQVGFTNATPSTDHLTSSGFHVFAFSSGIQPNPRAGGVYTTQY